MRTFSLLCRAYTNISRSFGKIEINEKEKNEKYKYFGSGRLLSEYNLEKEKKDDSKGRREKIIVISSNYIR